MSDKKRMGNLIANLDLDNIETDNILNTIFDLQYKFGYRFCPFDKLDDKSKLDWLIIFSDCIVDEISEVMGWLPWKHWKNYDGFIIESEEVKFELIDILHFVISLGHVQGIGPHEIVKGLCYGQGPEDLDVVCSQAQDDFYIETGSYLPITNDDDKTLLTMMYLRRLNHSVVLIQDTATKILDEGPPFGTAGDYYYTSHILNLFEDLFSLMLLWGFTARDIYIYYLAKNKENIDRQERGY